MRYRRCFHARLQLMFEAGYYSAHAKLNAMQFRPQSRCRVYMIFRKRIPSCARGRPEAVFQKVPALLQGYVRPSLQQVLDSLPPWVRSRSRGRGVRASKGKRWLVRSWRFEKKHGLATDSLASLRARLSNVPAAQKLTRQQMRLLVSRMAYLQKEGQVDESFDDWVFGLDQSVDRAIVLRACTPCVTPNCVFWYQNRLMNPWEMAALQGVTLSEMAELRDQDASLVQSLAGNAFCTHVIATLFVALLTELTK